MKKFLGFLTVLVLLVCVSVATIGCGKDDSSAKVNLTVAEAKQEFNKAIKNLNGDLEYNIIAKGDTVYGETRSELICKKVDGVVCYATSYFEEDDSNISYYGIYDYELLKLFASDSSYINTDSIYTEVSGEYNIGDPKAEERWVKHITGGVSENGETKINAKATMDEYCFEIEFVIKGEKIVSATQSIYEEDLLIGTFNYVYNYENVSTALIDAFDYPTASEILTWEEN